MCVFPIFHHSHLGVKLIEESSNLLEILQVYVKELGWGGDERSAASEASRGGAVSEARRAEPSAFGPGKHKSLRSLLRSSHHEGGDERSELPEVSCDECERQRVRAEPSAFGPKINQVTSLLTSLLTLPHLLQLGPLNLDGNLLALVVGSVNLPQTRGSKRLGAEVLERLVEIALVKAKFLRRWDVGGWYH